jgi:hypothetical protein
MGHVEEQLCDPPRSDYPLSGSLGAKEDKTVAESGAVRGSDRGTAAVVTDQCWPLWRLLEVTSSSDRRFSGQGGLRRQQWDTPVHLSKALLILH